MIFSPMIRYFSIESQCIRSSTLILIVLGLFLFDGCRCPPPEGQTVDGKTAGGPLAGKSGDDVNAQRSKGSGGGSAVRMLPLSVADLPADEVERRKKIEDLKQQWSSLPQDQRSEKLAQATAEASDRFKCNLVQGCPAEVVLIAAGEEAVDPIINKYMAMQSTTWTRFHLLEILGFVESPRVVPFLLERLDDDFWNARSSAAVALASAAQADLRGELEKRMALAQEKGDNSTMYGLAYSVAALGGKTENLLLKALDPSVMASENTGYTRIALDALANLGIQEVCPLLVPVLGHDDVFLRKSALRAAGIVRCSELPVIEAAASSLEHRVPSVRRLAQWSLRRMTGQAVTDRRTYDIWKSMGGK